MKRRCVIQDVLDKVLGVCDEDGAGGTVFCSAVTLEFYSVHYNQDGAAQPCHSPYL